MYVSYAIKHFGRLGIKVQREYSIPHSKFCFSSLENGNNTRSNTSRFDKFLIPNCRGSINSCSIAALNAITSLYITYIYAHIFQILRARQIWRNVEVQRAYSEMMRTFSFHIRHLRKILVFPFRKSNPGIQM